MPSITKIEVAPMSAIACNVAIVISLIYCGKGAPNRCHAAAARYCLTIMCAAIMGVASDVLFEVMVLLLSLLVSTVALIICVGFEENAETKWLHLCAIMFSAHPAPSKFPGILFCALLWCMDHILG
jgi:hypothetical protein